MLLLIFYVVIALGFSFLCSIAEAVILSVSSAYISVLEKEGRPSGALLRKQTDNINTPLSAILTLNLLLIQWEQQAQARKPLRYLVRPT